MFELIPIFTISTLFALISHLLSKYDREHDVYLRKEHFFYALMVISLIIFCGTRTYYNDTTVYTGDYEFEVDLLTNGYLKKIDWTIGKNPGFFLMMSVLKTLGFSNQSFILFFSFVTLSISYWFFWKYTNDTLFCSILAFVLYYTSTMAAVKQTFATALCLLAVDRLITKKKFLFVILILAASLVHPYALLYLICPLLMFKPWSRKTWYLLVFFGLFGVSFRLLSERIVFFTTLMGEEYTVENLTMHGMNPFRVAVRCVPIIISFFIRDRIKYSQEDYRDDLFVNLTMLSGEFSFVALFGTALLLGRISNYFMPFQILTIPWLIKFFDKKYDWIIKLVAIIFYLAFFITECYISGNDVFDNEFTRMTFFEYLRSII